MEKILAVLFLILFADYSNGALKSNLFLKNKFTVGHPASKNRADVEIKKPSGSQKVLYGHYTTFIEQRRIDEEEKELEAKTIPALLAPILKEVLKHEKGSLTSLGGRNANEPKERGVPLVSKLINPIIDPILTYVKLNLAAGEKDKASLSLSGTSANTKGSAQSLSKIIHPLLEPIMNFIKANLTEGVSVAVRKRSPRRPHIARKRGVETEAIVKTEGTLQMGRMPEEKLNVTLSNIVNPTINLIRSNIKLNADENATAAPKLKIGVQVSSQNAIKGDFIVAKVINPIVDPIRDFSQANVAAKAKQNTNKREKDGPLLSKIINPVLNPILDFVKLNLPAGAKAKRNAQLGGRSFRSPEGKSIPLVSSTLNPIIQPLLSYVKLSLEDHMKTARSLIKEGGSGSVGEREKLCKSHTKHCRSKVPEKQLLCACTCLTRGDEILSQLNHIIAPFLETFCLPLDTIYQKMFSFAQNNYEHFRKYNVFLAVLESTKRSLGEVASSAWKSVMTNIIDLVQCNMMPLRLVTGQFDIALQGAIDLEPRVDSTHINRVCAKVDGLKSLVMLVDIFNRGPDLIDALLSGFSTISLIAKYVPVGLQSIFAATTGAIRFLTGTSCGLIHFAMKGEVPKCDQVGGSLVLVPGMPLPEGTQDLELRPECIEPAADYRMPSRRKRSLNTEFNSYEAILNGMADGVRVPTNPELSDSLRHRDNRQRMIMKKKRSLRVRRRM